MHVANSLVYNIPQIVKDNAWVTQTFETRTQRHSKAFINIAIIPITLLHNIMTYILINLNQRFKDYYRETLVTVVQNNYLIKTGSFFD